MRYIFTNPKQGRLVFNSYFEISLWLDLTENETKTLVKSGKRILGRVKDCSWNCWSIGPLVEWHLEKMSAKELKKCIKRFRLGFMGIGK